MKERAIIMSGDNPRLIWEGRKTQTRRIGKYQKDDATELEVEHVTHATKGLEAVAIYRAYPKGGTARHALCSCPYGVAGDRLWVRETLRRHPARGWYYSADGEAGSPITMFEDNPNVGTMLSWAHHKDGDTCPSIHMPRWASRITLEITKVRVERLQDITEADAVAEGIKPRPHDSTYRFATEDYAHLWQSLHGSGSWDKNPWVWVIEFKTL